ncbi:MULTISPECIES: 2-hydroxymuconate tautomerase [Aerococcus]|uniref:DUF1904 family protein n=2 Tax=Aerococcus TaxID=1375 RepID=A0ABT4BYH7_9LACT|nr:MULTISPECIES: 2-hydroxymuconate tautomerase [Aerococcus]KAA9234135.1 DUF1904 family protein [Aerococcus mictus]KAA9242046.1 DUF1904 family protein [Aerococcus urinae]MCY3025318.1 DUF1904 family protein [Aerococcus loyolae]MCY3027768.1 DUF1904 family protein [Aerococcus loyolae]MCY3029145.1 DUF1904 family protein [Aerococcus loyolae]
MPVVNIQLIEGRSQEVKAAIAKEITESISKHANTPKDHVHVIFNDMKKGDYYNNN